VDRVVVEPDARNTKIQALNSRLGFRPAGVVTLPDKEALLSFCTQADFQSARTARRGPARHGPDHWPGTDHPTTDHPTIDLPTTDHQHPTPGQEASL
jgi:Acetyltransferase (GNAT) domain